MCMLKIHNLCIAASDFGDDFEEPDAEDCKRLLTNTAAPCTNQAGTTRRDEVCCDVAYFGLRRREQPLMW